MPFSIRPYRRFPVHNPRMIKQVFVGCALVAGLTSCVQEVKTVSIHANCPEIPATTFAAVGLDANAGAITFGKLVTVGEFRAKTTPALLSAISQSVRDDQITDALICAAKERGELKNDEQIAHAWKVARFYRTSPTPAEAMEFDKQNPFPATLGKSLNPIPYASPVAPGPENQAQTCGPSLSTTIKPAVFVPQWIPVLNRMREERNIHDIRNLMSVWGRTPVGREGTELIDEAIFTLNCLEKQGQLKMEELHPPSFIGSIQNKRIIFLKPMITIPE